MLRERNTDTEESMHAPMHRTYWYMLPERKQKTLMQMEKYTRTETPNGVFGIYMDTDIIHVRILTGGKSQPVLSMPAYFNLDDLDDVLTGRRAVVQANMNPKKLCIPCLPLCRKQKARFLLPWSLVRFDIVLL